MTSQPLDHQAVGVFQAPLAHRFVRFMKFALVGGSGVAVNLVVFQLCFLLSSSVIASASWRHAVANLCGILVSIFSNFLLNDGWTWGDRDKGALKDWCGRVARYYAACSIAATCQLGVSSFLYSTVFKSLGSIYLFGVDVIPPIPLFIGCVCGMAINFPLSHFWAFRAANSRDHKR